LKPAKYWVKKDSGAVQCQLCPHQCVIKPDKEGICRNKKNLGGELFAHRYGEVSAVAMDPIEKKPLYHFYPGSQILSIGTVGCNFSCDFCQNFHLVEATVPTEQVTAEDLVSSAKKHGSIGIAYTYNEPFMSFEFVRDCAIPARKAGLKNVLVTNGFYNPEPFAELLPYIDAMNIDLKSIRPEYYRKWCHGKLEPVLATIETAHRKCLVELTNLVVTGLNDSDQDLSDLVDWVAKLNPEIPLHFSAYRPMHKMKNPATPIERLRKAYELAKGKLKWVYVGNVYMDVGEDSICPNCGALLVRRRGYDVRVAELDDSRCGKCRTALNFIND
jgi:pyruvate formate lyase activating enzyme